MAFGRKNKNTASSVDPYAHVGSGKFVEERERVATTGPFDLADQPHEDREYLDFGALKVLPFEGLAIRLEVEEDTGRVVAITFDYQGSSLQVQVFAAPRKDGLWEQVREQIAESITAQQGEVRTEDGLLGTELIASVPAVANDGSQGFRLAKFMGVDGPRWFLRGVFAGPAATGEGGGELWQLLKDCVVVRGNAPMPPAELLALHVPQEATGHGVSSEGDASGESQTLAQPDGAPTPDSLRRGPEITQIG